VVCQSCSVTRKYPQRRYTGYGGCSWQVTAPNRKSDEISRAEIYEKKQAKKIDQREERTPKTNIDPEIKAVWSAEKFCQTRKAMRWR